jgi:TolB-like protein/cytochrome c-type biogenesis protein CcmH/NrfG
MPPAPERAVFLSYASQDAEAARRICEALRAAGVEVWFDQSELVGGDAWDQKIRKQIKECALFVPIISAATQARSEGYFRLEWKLAVDRSHLMADDQTFLFPVVIDDTPDATARVPDKFRDVQWTRLNVKDRPETLAKRVAELLGAGADVGRGLPTPPGQSGVRTSAGSGDPALQRTRGPSWIRVVSIIGGILIGLIYAIRGVIEPARVREAKPAAVAPASPPPAAVMSPARQLAEKARLLIDALDSTADDFATAEGLVKRALELEQNDGEIWAISSRLNSMFLSRSFDSGPSRRETARSQSERALKLVPDSVEVLLAVARVNRNTDAPRAEAALRQALVLAPKDGRLLLNLGSLYRVQNRLEEAMTHYERAAAVPDVMPLARYDQYLATFYQRKFAEADRYVREAATALPSANFVTGQAMVELTWRGQPDAALRVLAAAPGKVRAEPRPVIVTVLAAQMNRQPEEALMALRRFPADYVNDAWYTGPKALLVGLCEAQAGRPEAARVAWESGIALLRRRLQDTPNNPDEHLRLGELLAWSGQTEAALGEVKIFEQLTNGRGTDWTFSAARIYAALGRADEAVPLLANELVAAWPGRWPLTPALLRLDPLWDKIRGDPRFQALCVEPAATAATPEGKSVAVLAFANLSDDKANEYFSDGISEELLNVLAKVPGLKVTARTSSFHFKGMNTAIPEIAQQLGVAYVVEGSVRKSGTQVRITAQLIKAADGFHVWSDTFTRDLKDIFAVQDEIAGLIAQNLSLKLGASSSASTAAINPEAFDCYVQAVQAWNLRTQEGSRRAEELLKRALTLEPNFARAHAALAAVWGVSVEFTEPDAWSYGWRNSASLARMQQEARQAVALDPASAEAYAALGGTFPVWQNAEGIAALRRAVELNPNYATAHQWLGYALFYDGRVDDALRELARAAELDPLSHRIHDIYARCLGLAGRHTEALAAAERALQIQPESGQANLEKGAALVGLARMEAGVPFVLKAAALQPYQGARAVQVLARAGQLDAIEQLAKSSVARANSQFEFNRRLARHEPDAAFTPRAVDQITMFEDLLLDPLYDFVRGDPRFLAILRELNLTDAHQRAQAWRKAHPPEKAAAKQ